MGSRFLRGKSWSFRMKAVSVNKEVLALISRIPETGFVPKRDNVVAFGDMVSLQKEEMYWWEDFEL